MIRRVCEQAQQAASIDTVVVATDDVRISQHVLGWGGQVFMTDSAHPSGTDRCAEVVRKHFPQADVVVNIQGDEPFIQPGQIDLLVRTLLDNQWADIATLAKKAESPALLDNPNTVKVVFSSSTRQALYFSRYPVPFLRGVEPANRLAHGMHYKHIGLYAYRRLALLDIATYSPTPLEQAESLEQLRWLEHGRRIVVGITEWETVGIDTPEDLEGIDPAAC